MSGSQKEVSAFLMAQAEFNKIIWEHHAPSEENVRVLQGSYDFGLRLAFGGVLDDTDEESPTCTVEILRDLGDAEIVPVEVLPKCASILSKRTVYKLGDRLYEPCVTEKSLMECLSSPLWWQYLINVHIVFNRLTNDSSTSSELKQNAFKRVSRVTALYDQLRRLLTEHEKLAETAKARIPLFYSDGLVEKVADMILLFNELSPGTKTQIVNPCTREESGRYCIREVHTNEAGDLVVKRLSKPLSEQLHDLRKHGWVAYSCQMPPSNGNATLQAVGQFMLDTDGDRKVIGQCMPSDANAPFNSAFLRAEHDAVRQRIQDYQVMAQTTECTLGELANRPSAPPPSKSVRQKAPPLLSEIRCSVERKYRLPPFAIQKAMNNRTDLVGLELKDPTLIDARQVGGMYNDYTILMAAAKKGKIDVLKFLCDSENEFFPDPFLVVLNTKTKKCMTARDLVDTCTQCTEEDKKACKAELFAYEEYYKQNEKGTIADYKTFQIKRYQYELQSESNKKHVEAVKRETDNISDIVKSLLDFVNKREPKKFVTHFTNLTQSTREKIARMQLGTVLPENYPFFPAYKDKTLLQQAVKKDDVTTACKLLKAGAVRAQVDPTKMSEEMQEVLDKGDACDDDDDSWEYDNLDSSGSVLTSEQSEMLMKKLRRRQGHLLSNNQTTRL